MSHDTMQAVRLHEYGGPEVLVVDQAPIPHPQPDQVLVRLVAAGVNPADVGFRSGYFKEFFPIELPWIPGVDGSGIVEEVGEEVTRFHKGQAVFGRIWGSYAEYAAVPAADLQLKPAHLTFEQAAAVQQGALTAWQALETANLQPNQRVLIQGAAGGVGLFAVQLARLKGALVIGTASANNIEFVRSLGALMLLITTPSILKRWFTMWTRSLIRLEAILSSALGKCSNPMEFWLPSRGG